MCQEQSAINAVNISIRDRFYTIGWSGISICSFAAAKVQKKIDIYKFLSIYLLNRGDFYGILQVFQSQTDSPTRL